MKRRRLYELASRFHGPSGLPIIGNVLKFLLPPEKIPAAILEGLKYYKSPTKIWFGPKLAIYVWHPKHLEVVLNNPHCLHKNIFVYKLTESFLGKSILNLPLEQWKKHRRMIAPAFNKKNFEGFFDVYQKHSSTLIKELKTEEGKGLFDIEKYLLETTMKIVLESFLNYEDHKKQPSSKEILEWLFELQSTTIKRCTYVWLLVDFIFNRTNIGKRFNKVHQQFHNFLDTVIDEWKKDVLNKQLDNNEGIDVTEVKQNAKFVEHLLSTDEDGKFTDEELRDEVKTLIVAGMETTATEIGYTLLLLGMFPNIQEKLYEEVMEVVGPTRDIQTEDIKRLKYLDLVLKESVRIFPAGVGFLRTTDEEIQLDEYILPADCTILIGLLSVHRDPEIWPNPTKFDPERFLPQNVAKRNPYSWIPFSAGPRNCIGLRFAMLVMKVLVMNLVRSYEIKTSYKNINDVELTLATLLKPTHGYNVSLKLRDRLN